MFGKTSRVVVIVLALLALVGTVSAQVNNPINGFMGGDGLFCNKARGCYLLNEKGVLLGEFPQADIQGALATCAAQGTNVIIGTIDGTYGPFTLAAVYDGPNATPVCSLQFNGTEAAGKPSKSYTFMPNPNGGYQPLPIPVLEISDPTAPVVPPVPPQPCWVEIGNTGLLIPVSVLQGGDSGYWLWNGLGQLTYQDIPPAVVWSPSNGWGGLFHYGDCSPLN